ncbi:MAG: hypothetical protein WBZ51_26650, partial [Xanthobacteraceae bacterium]
GSIVQTKTSVWKELGNDLGHLLVDRFHETNRIEWMELKPTDLILRSSARLVARRASRRMAAGTISLVAVLRDARKRAPQDEVD